MSEYIKRIQQLLSEMNAYETDNMTRAAQLIYEAIQKGGILQIFGSGHSQLLAQEAFYRAGGLVPVKPISIEPLMLHKGAMTSSNNEKDATRAEEFWSQIELSEQDVLLVISTSGKNPIPVEIAMRAKKMGVAVITLQSLIYKDELSKHQSGNRLEDYADVVLNTRVPIGDGVLQHAAVQFGPVSTILGATLLNEVIAKVIYLFSEANETPPVFMSSNVEGTGNKNESWMNRYKNRINFN